MFTISEITREIKELVEGGFPEVTVLGEISNCKLHTSGHLYLTLKDENCQLSAVMWRSRVGRLAFRPQDGMKIVARGKITVYEVRGVYQLDILELHTVGAGELQLAFERLKKKLAGEGLFDSERKRPLPEFPQRIGLVTSRTGAALRDIVSVISRRCPVVELILMPVQVQGVGAAGDIARAIEAFNGYGGIDVLIVGRGGGSIEDLWAFNEEVVARAIFHSRIPVVSAVGHEVDYTIADFVADLRAPTPSAAAEIVVPDKSQFIESITNFCYTGKQVIQEQLAAERDRIHSLLRSYAFNRPIDALRRHAQHLDDLKHSLHTVLAHRHRLIHQQLHSLVGRIGSLDPEMVLRRGYAIVHSEGKITGSALALHPGGDLNIQFHDGEVPARVSAGPVTTPIDTDDV